MIDYQRIDWLVRWAKHWPADILPTRLAKDSDDARPSLGTLIRELGDTLNVVQRELATREVEMGEALRERDRARDGISMVFQLINTGDLELVHMLDEDGLECPQDDTCSCRIRRFMLLLQIAGAAQDTPEALIARSYLERALPAPGPHDRADCPCGHLLGTQGVCGGCNCADDEP